jgi:hypothetical protein
MLIWVVIFISKEKPAAVSDSGGGEQLMCVVWADHALDLGAEQVVTLRADRDGVSGIDQLYRDLQV